MSFNNEPTPPLQMKVVFGHLLTSKIQGDVRDKHLANVKLEKRSVTSGTLHHQQRGVNTSHILKSTTVPYGIKMT